MGAIRRAIRFVADEWAGVAVVFSIAFVGGSVAAVAPVLWFRHGVCW